MERIHPYDSAWLSTFPQPVAPQPDEWFPGLLLRCDEVNHWESGTTADFICPIKKYRSRGGSNWIVVPQSALELLAQLLSVPKNSLLGTTFQLELASLYDTPNPHATYLRRSCPFQLCPDCIAEGRLLKRTIILPHIASCPTHLLTLVRTCRCGTALQLFVRHSLPFTCQKCCMDWAKLSRLSADKERVALEKNLISFYTFFFDDARPTTVARAQQLVRERVRKKDEYVKSFNGEIKYVELYDAKRLSLGLLVELLVSLGLSPDDIMAYQDPLPWWSMKTNREEKSI